MKQLGHEAEIGSLAPDEKEKADLGELLRGRQPHEASERARRGGETGVCEALKSVARGKAGDSAA
eukprot:scaffold273145_cov27-Tisochrysis_lutea.AAC.1